MNTCSECRREIDPSGESLTEDQHWICQTCIQKVTVSPGAVVVPLLHPVYHRKTISVEEHIWYWLKSHPREHASWMVRDTVESKI